MIHIQFTRTVLPASALLLIACQSLAMAETVPSTAPSAGRTAEWDTLSGQVLPEVLARSGAASMANAYRSVSCLIDVEAGSSFARDYKGTLRVISADKNNDGIISEDEVQVRIESVSPTEMTSQIEMVRGQLQAQELGSLRNLLLLNPAQTQRSGKGFVVQLKPGGPESILTSLGMTEMNLTVSGEFGITGMTVHTVQGAESDTQYELKKMEGQWYPQGYTRRTSLPDGGNIAETATTEYELIKGMPLPNKVHIRSEVKASSGESAAKIRLDLSLRDWELIKRNKPIGQFDAQPLGSAYAELREGGRSTSQPSRREAEKRVTGPGGPKISGLEKYVSPQAHFVACRPIGWKVREETQEGYLAITVQDPTEQYQVGMVCGANPFGNKRGALLKVVLDQLRRKYNDFKIGNVRESTDGGRLVFDADYKDVAAGRREGRCWLSLAANGFVFSYCATPSGQFEASRSTMLSILENIRILKNTIPAPQKQMPLVERRLADGSASFLAPANWRVQDSGTGHFAATDPSGRYSFVVAKVDMLTPQLGVRVPGAIVLAYMAPHRAMQTLTVSSGLLSDFKLEEVTPREDVARLIGQVYTAGQVTAEEFTYTATGKAGRSKAYTFGISWNSRLDTNWVFSHLTVGAPAAEFDAWAPTLARMVQSYKINDQFAARYIAEGTARLRRMQQDTARIIAKNAEDIHTMMQAAYDERQRSQDYIDYQRTTYIRGETDWISSMEGGSVYHSDSWGTKNTWTGESWEGAPYNHVNFEGQNPKYDEQMTKIDSRQLYEQAFGKSPSP